VSFFTRHRAHHGRGLFPRRPFRRDRRCHPGAVPPGHHPGRYLGDLPLPDEFDPALNPVLKPEVRAAGEARQALQWAAASLLPEPAARESMPDADTHPVVRHLSAAADLLTAGRDLLHTHFTGPPSAQTARSDWAAVILSWPLTSALISEVAACARRLAPWAAQLPGTGLSQPGGPAAAAAGGLRIASRWLWTPARRCTPRTRARLPRRRGNCWPPSR